MIRITFTNVYIVLFSNHRSGCRVGTVTYFNRSNEHCVATNANLIAYNSPMLRHAVIIHHNGCGTDISGHRRHSTEQEKVPRRHEHHDGGHATLHQGRKKH